MEEGHEFGRTDEPSFDMALLARMGQAFRCHGGRLLCLGFKKSLEEVFCLLLTYLLTYILTYLLTYLLTY